MIMQACTATQTGGCLSIIVKPEPIAQQASECPTPIYCQINGCQGTCGWSPYGDDDEHEDDEEQPQPDPDDGAKSLPLLASSIPPYPDTPEPSEPDEGEDEEGTTDDEDEDDVPYPTTIPLLSEPCPYPSSCSSRVSVVRPVVLKLQAHPDPVGV